MPSFLDSCIVSYQNSSPVKVFGEIGCCLLELLIVFIKSRYGDLERVFYMDDHKKLNKANKKGKRTPPTIMATIAKVFSDTFIPLLCRNSRPFESGSITMR